MNKTGTQLLQLTLQLHADMWQALDLIDVTPLQAYVLIYVSEHRDPPARASDVAHLLRLRLPTISELLLVMQHKKWLISRRHLHDRRSKALTLTKTGEELMDRTVTALNSLCARYGGNHTGSADAIRLLTNAVKQ